jgi:hypothetical protein
MIKCKGKEVSAYGTVRLKSCQKEREHWLKSYNPKPGNKDH